jgi:hypothetical protein
VKKIHCSFIDRASENPTLLALFVAQERLLHFACVKVCLGSRRKKFSTFSLPEGTGGPMRDLLIAVVIMSSMALAIAVGVGLLLG